MPPVVPRQKHHRQTGKRATPDTCRRFAPWAGDRGVLGVFEPGQIVDPRSADDAKDRLCHFLSTPSPRKCQSAPGRPIQPRFAAILVMAEAGNKKAEPALRACNASHIAETVTIVEVAAPARELSGGPRIWNRMVRSHDLDIAAEPVLRAHSFSRQHACSCQCRSPRYC